MKKSYEECRVRLYKKLTDDVNNYLNIGKVLKSYNKRIYDVALKGFSKDKSALYYCNKIESMMIYKVAAYDRYLNMKKFLSELKYIDKRLLIDYCQYMPTDLIASKYDISSKTIFRKIEAINKSYELFNKRENENCLVAEV